MMYLGLIILGVICFMAGWIAHSFETEELIEKAKSDIRYVNTLKRKEYAKGYNSALNWRDYGRK